MTGSSPTPTRDLALQEPRPPSESAPDLPQDAVVMPKRGLQLPQQLSFERWVNIGRRLSDVYATSAWCLGDWLVYGEATYQGRYREAAEQTSLDYQTLRNYAWVAKRFSLSRRRDSLSFAHHAEVASLPQAEQNFWLRKAEELGWTVKRLRHEVRASLTERATPGHSPKTSSDASNSTRSSVQGDSKDKRTQMPSPVSAATVGASAWEEGCSEWILLSRDVLHVMEMEMAADTQTQQHHHPNTRQFYYVLAGSAIVDVESTRITARTGQAIEISPGDTHQISNEADTTLRFLVISSGPPQSDRKNLR